MDDGNELTEHPQPLSANRFVVLVRDAVGWRRVFGVQYERVNGKLGYYVHLPYFAHSQGLLRRVRLSAPTGGSEHVDMASEGLTTTRRLKFAHHPDGEAHFSQDGNARTVVRAKTKPLNEHGNHLFTVTFWETSGFQLAKPTDFKRPTDRRTTVGFQFAEDLPPQQVAARIIGFRYPLSNVEFHESFPLDHDFGRPILFVTPSGKTQNGIPLFPRNGTADDFFIMLTYASIDRLISAEGSSLVLIGGFHRSEDAHSSEPENSLIAIQYADRKDEWEVLSSSLESIDYERPSPLN